MSQLHKDTYKNLLSLSLSKDKEEIYANKL